MIHNGKDKLSQQHSMRFKYLSFKRYKGCRWGLLIWDFNFKNNILI